MSPHSVLQGCDQKMVLFVLVSMWRAHAQFACWLNDPTSTGNGSVETWARRQHDTSQHTHPATQPQRSISLRPWLAVSVGLFPDCVVRGRGLARHSERHVGAPTELRGLVPGVGEGEEGGMAARRADQAPPCCLLRSRRRPKRVASRERHCRLVRSTEVARTEPGTGRPTLTSPHGMPVLCARRTIGCWQAE